jgi:hypothetical protein
MPCRTKPDDRAQAFALTSIAVILRAGWSDWSTESDHSHSRIRRVSETCAHAPVRSGPRDHLEPVVEVEGRVVQAAVLVSSPE